MKYYLIVGEASGDLHASNLMKSLQRFDPQSDFRYFGGDLMQAVGGTMVQHYKDLAYMGFIPVLLHLRTIFRNMNRCKEDIMAWRPDVVILVDYPGFNLKIARFVHAQGIPVYYYISPKIWAWKEYRIRNIKQDVDELFSILPFEVEFFRKHQYPIHYVGNPCVDAVHAYCQQHPADPEGFRRENGLDSRPIIALLAGSRKQEIKDNLPIMIQVASQYPDYQLVLAGAPGVPREYYDRFLVKSPVKILFGQTYPILQHASAALVTSGTATLETALFRVPQVVCYVTFLKSIVGFLRKRLLKVPYISLVNLIANRPVVCELVADTMTSDNLHRELQAILPEGSKRTEMLQEYERLIQILGPAGASDQAAKSMLACLAAFRKA